MRQLLFILAAALAAFNGCAPDRSAEIAGLHAQLDSLRALAGPPPASLDSLYPPLAQAPVYQLAMFEMATPFTASTLKMSEGDAAASKKYFERFRAAYLKTAGMVPEWKGLFPVAPIDEMAAAIGEGDPGRVMAAAQKVGAVCHDCHAVTMAKVQQLKRWPEFSEITLTDPRSGRDVRFPEYMMALEGSMTGIGVGLEEGSMEAARRSFAEFNAAMGGLRESCGACHDTERAYYVDRSVQASIDALGMALRAPTPDPGTIGGLMMRIGQESCGKCHLVHVPAAYTQARLGKQATAHTGQAAGH